MEVAEFMHLPVTISPTDALVIAAELMRDHEIGCLAVTNGLQPVGIITDRDITVRCTIAGHDPRRCTVDCHMSTPLVTTRPDADLFEAVRLMLSYRVKRLLVVERDHLVGVISLSDVAAALDEPIHELLGAMGSARRSRPPELVLP